jgi:hypothetical protein
MGAEGRERVQRAAFQIYNFGYPQIPGMVSGGCKMLGRRQNYLHGSVGMTDPHPNFFNSPEV